MKFLGTNLTVEQYVHGLERTLTNLPGILEEWETPDSDLKYAYCDQMEWMLTQVTEGYQEHVYYRHAIAMSVIGIHQLLCNLNYDEWNLNVLTEQEWADILALIR